MYKTFVINIAKRILARSGMTKYLIVVYIFIVSIFIFLTKLNGIYEQYDSFQTFSYPSMMNFYKILQLNNSNIVPKLLNYEPRLIQHPKSDGRQDINILIIVKSALINVRKRHEIRRSWGLKACKFVHRYQVYFAVGQRFIKDDEIDEQIQIQIDQEAKRENDILQFDFVDRYKNNTYKVLSIIDYFVKYHSEVPYLVIADDDYFIDPSNLSETIENDITKEEYPRFLGGYVWYQTKPVRNSFSKWFVSYLNYRFEYYPPYPAGGFVLISNPMVKICQRLLPYLKYNSIDDVFLGILMFKLKIYPSHLSNVYLDKPKPFPKDLLACHGFSKNLQSFWETNQFVKKCTVKHAQQDLLLKRIL